MPTPPVGLARNGADPKGRLTWLDGLRGMAVLLILLHHFFPAPPDGEFGSIHTYLHKAQTLAFTGVDLFFVLSGFLIGGILIDRRDSPRLAQTFYIRRALRIVPLAWIFLAVVCVCTRAGILPSFALTPPDHSIPWWGYAGFIPNLYMALNLNWGDGALSHTWSLGVEEQFYLVAPWLVLMFRRTKLIALFLVAVGVFSRLALLYWFPASALAAHFLPFCRADAFGVGILAAVIFRDGAALHSLQSRRRRWWVAWIFGGSLMLLFTQWRTHPGDPALVGGGYSVIAAFYGTTLLLIGSSRHDWARRIWSMPWLVRFGRYSYFIYLFQQLFGSLLARAASQAGHPGFSTSFLPLLIVPLLLVFAAAASWRWIEKPLLDLGHRQTY